MEMMTPTEVQRLNQEFESQPAETVLRWALDTLDSRVALASSFGAEDVVLIDMLSKINPKARIFTLDTLRLNTETYDVIDRVRGKYRIPIEIFTPGPSAVADMVEKNGYNLFYAATEMRKLCCGVRKVEPLGRALSTLDGWMTGLRREQGVTRVSVPKIEIDAGHNGILKLNPIADWTWDQLWDYIRANDVPYNELHDRGYPSIGCDPCTRAIEPGEDMRAGRWWWENDPGSKECGLHVGPHAETAADAKVGVSGDGS